MENSPWDVVVVSSNLENRQDVAGMLFRLGVDPICLSSVEQCKNLPRRENIRLVFCDRKVKGGDYRDVLSAVSSDLPGCTPKVVMMSELVGPGEYQQARHNGIFDVITSPCRQTDIEWMVILAKRYARRQTKDLIESTRNLSLLWKAAGAGA